MHLVIYFSQRHHMSTHSTLHHCPLPQMPPSPPVSAAHWSPGPGAPKAAEDHVGSSVTPSGFVSHRLFPAEQGKQENLHPTGSEACRALHNSGCCYNSAVVQRGPTVCGSPAAGEHWGRVSLLTLGEKSTFSICSPVLFHKV